MTNDPNARRIALRWVVPLFGMTVLPVTIAFGMIVSLGHDSPYLVGYGLYAPLLAGVVAAWSCPLRPWGKVALCLTYAVVAFPTLLALGVMTSVS